MTIIVNNVSNETWICDNINDVVLIEGVEFIKVYKSDNKTNVLMNKSTTRQVVTNEMNYSQNKNLLNG